MRRSVAVGVLRGLHDSLEPVETSGPTGPPGTVCTLQTRGSQGRERHLARIAADVAGARDETRDASVPSWRSDVVAALLPWALARVIVVGALGLSRFVASGVHLRPRPVALHQGLFAWDASFYRAIAEHGYHRADDSLRFFPLVPMLTRALGWVTGDGVALLVVVNVSALALAVLLARLVRFETGDNAAAQRVMWLVALAPPAGILVLGYAEATFSTLAVVAFLGLRRGRWWTAAIAGFLAGLTRPFGALLAPAAAIELWRSVRAGRRPIASGAVAVVAPLAGAGVFLAWVGARYGDWLAPLHLQERRVARGGFQDPVSSLATSARELVHGSHVGTGLHFVWAVVFVALLVVVARRLPASYTVFAGIGVLVVLSAHNLDSMERYGLSLFPLVVAAALLTTRERARDATFAACAAGLLAYSVLTFFGLYVP